MAYRRRYFTTETPVTTQVIAQGAVTTQKIYDRTILSEDIGREEVKSENIAPGAVRLSHLGSDVPAIGITDGSITESKLANDAVSAAKIIDGAVISGKLGAGAVTPVKLATDAVETVKIKDAAVTPAKLSFVPAAGYVPRDAAVPDFDKNDFVWDGNPVTDGLDLSGIVPVGAKAVVLDVLLQVRAMSDEDSTFTVGRDFTIYPSNRGDLVVKYATWSVNRHFIIPCDADRKFDYVAYQGTLLPGNLELTVIGWFI